MTSITIPTSVGIIYNNAFEGCTSLTSITIPGSIYYIYSNAFKGCTSLASVIIESKSNSNTYGFYVTSDAFQGCTALSSVSFNRYEISGASICTLFPLVTFTSFTIPTSISKINSQAFKGCTSLTSITIPGSIYYIYSNAFKGCTSLTSITIPGSIYFISSQAFKGCTSLASVTIERSINYYGNIIINSWAFEGCTSLTSVSILNSKAIISYDAFSGCPSLKCIYFNNDQYSLKSCCPDGTVIKDMSCYRTCEAPFEYYDLSSNSCVQCPYFTASTDSTDIYVKDNIYHCDYFHFGLNKGGTIIILLLLILVFISCLAFIRDENNAFDFKLIAGSYHLS